MKKLIMLLFACAFVVGCGKTETEEVAEEAPVAVEEVSTTAAEVVEETAVSVDVPAETVVEADETARSE
jgi:uncharacterized protein YcfL